MSEPDPLIASDESPSNRPVNGSAVPSGPGETSFDFGPSPYQSPAILPHEEQAMVWGRDPVSGMPIAASVLFAIVASVVTVAAASASSRLVDVYFPFAMFFGPLMLIGLFVLTAIAYYSSNPLVISKSTGWKVLMVLLVPPVSMLVFVPTCVGSTMVMMPFVFQHAMSELMMLVPVFIAYFVCAVVISNRLKWRFLKRLDIEDSSS